MSIIRIKDDGDHTMRLVEVDGYRISQFGPKPEETFRNFKRLQQLQCLSDDVLICAPMKSGTHWTWEIVSMLKNGSADYMDGSKMEKMIEARSLETIGELPSPRILNSHLQYSRLPQSVVSQNVNIVFVVRNPKDTVVSWYKHCSGLVSYDYDGKFDDFLNLFYKNKLEYGDYFEYMLEWEGVIQARSDLVHLVYYEDMQQNLLREIERLAIFLGISGSQCLYEEMAKKCTFSEMSANREYSAELRDQLYKDNFSLFRKGKVGCWKNIFTVTQNEMFDRVWAERMKDSALKFTYTLSN